jgi:hypothetical protein
MDDVDRDAALETLVTLMGKGYAGLDCYDDTRFVVFAPEPFLTEGEDALDDLRASILTSSRLGVKPLYVSALLRNPDFLALGLDASDAPRLEVPLASRRVLTDLPR